MTQSKQSKTDLSKLRDSLNTLFNACEAKGIHSHHVNQLLKSVITNDEFCEQLVMTEVLVDQLVEQLAIGDRAHSLKTQINDAHQQLSYVQASCSHFDIFVKCEDVANRDEFGNLARGSERRLECTLCGRHWVESTNAARSSVTTTTAGTMFNGKS